MHRVAQLRPFRASPGFQRPFEVEYRGLMLLRRRPVVIHPDAEILRKPQRRVLRAQTEHLLIQADCIAALSAAEAIPCAITVDAQRSSFLAVQWAARPVLGTVLFQLQSQTLSRFQRRNLPHLLKNAQRTSLPVQLAPQGSHRAEQALLLPLCKHTKPDSSR